MSLLYALFVIGTVPAIEFFGGASSNYGEVDALNSISE